MDETMRREELAAEEAKAKEKEQTELPPKPPVFSFPVQLNAMELWKFSMYHANRGFLGLFNVFFTVAAVYLLITQWSAVTAPYRLLLILCVLMFTVWQPGSLYRKAKRQAKVPAVREPMVLSFGDSGLTVEQQGQRATIPWEDLAQVVGTKWQMIIYRDRIHAFLLPKSAYSEKEQELKAYIQEKLPAARRKRI